MSEDRVRVARIVDVWAQVSSQEGSYGSGYLVASSLVLTSLHVVAAGVPEFEDSPEWDSTVSRPYAQIKIRHLQGQRWWTCKILWPSPDVPVKCDAALLEITDGDWRPEGELSRWGKPTVEDSRLTVGAIGFPSAQRRKDGTRDPERITGICNPSTGMRSRHYQIVVTDGLRGSGSQWSGMSGAAVLSNGLIMALVIEYLKDSQGTRLRALPVERLFEVEGFRATMQAVTGSEPILESIELAPLLSTPAPPLRARPESENFSPASLLRADAEVVRFRGRVEDLERLITWCEAGERCSVRLLVGPGGQGKTRLARQLAIQLQRNGWNSGLLTEQADIAAAQANLQYLTCPTLLVVDYAEARAQQVRTLLNLGTNYKGTAPLRVLLIARSKGDWWDEFSRMESAARKIVEDASVDDLLPLEPTVDGRFAAYREALEDLANEFGQSVHDPYIRQLLNHPPDMSHPRYAQALMVQMVALIPFLETRPGPATEAQAIILKREESYWSRVATRYGLTIHPNTLRLIVATHCLCSAYSQRELTELLLQIRSITDQSADVRMRVELWLHDLYPLVGTENSEEPLNLVGTLAPDRLAEYLVTNVFRDDREFLVELLGSVSKRQAQHAFATLASAAAFDATVDEMLKEVIRRVPPLALAAAQVAPRSENPAPLIAAIGQLLPRGISEAEYPGLWTELYRVIHPRSAVFAELSVSLERSNIGSIRLLSEIFPETKRQFADSLRILFNRLYNARKYDEALDTALQSLEISRPLSRSENNADLLRLAGSLTDLCVALRAMGYFEQSLSAIQEAVAIYRQKLPSDESIMVRLGTALHHLSDALVSEGSEREATAAIEESLRIREALASEDPTQLPGLIYSLSSLAARRYKAGRTDEALELSDRSIGIGERLLDQGRDLYVRDLATCVELRIGLLFDAGRLTETLAADTRLIELRKELARGTETGYLVDLAWALSARANHLRKAGRNEEALRVSSEAMDTYRRIPRHATNDSSNAGQLFRIAEVLFHHSLCLSGAGDLEAAYSFARDATEVYQKLAEHRPEEYAPALADALRSLAFRALGVEKLNEGSRAIEQSIGIMNALVTLNIQKYEPRLTMFSFARGLLRWTLATFGKPYIRTPWRSLWLKNIIKMTGPNMRWRRSRAFTYCWAMKRSSRGESSLRHLSIGQKKTIMELE